MLNGHCRMRPTKKRAMGEIKEKGLLGGVPDGEKKKGVL